MELCLEINGKLQALLEDTLIKNLSEFKLESTEWEKVIIDYFILNNKDPKVAEPIRNLDLENLSKYLPLIKNTKIKQQVLMELLRSATHEKRVKKFSFLSKLKKES